MTGFVVNKGFDPLFEAASFMLRVNKPRPGSTNKESERNLVTFMGEREGMFRGLAWLATQERVLECGILPDDAWIDSIDSHAVRTWWDGIDTRWVAGEWKDVDDNTFHVQLRREWTNELILSDGMREKIEAYRRSLVLDGKLEPTEDDRVWIIEERERLAAVVSPYDAVLNKLS
jgi:hypothetical protein